jgi:hypothetical protein
MAITCSPKKLEWMMGWEMSDTHPQAEPAKSEEAFFF